MEVSDVDFKKHDELRITGCLEKDITKKHLPAQERIYSLTKDSGMNPRSAGIEGEMYRPEYSCLHAHNML